jgi:hypothetical protein
MAFGIILLSLADLAGVAVVRAHAESSAPPDKAIGIIFCDGFESRDTSAWRADGCTSTLDIPVAITE